jgi:WD40 repeat protein
VAEESAASVARCPRCGQSACEEARSAVTLLVGRPRVVVTGEPSGFSRLYDTPTRTSEPLPATQADFVLPLIPGYTLIDELGRGGMGVVYRARQDALGRVVALKTIQASASLYPDIVARFRSEAESIARLRHPNIVQIHEIGTGATGPYLVMEYAEGGTLAQRLDGTPLVGRTAAALVRTLARAMQAAHAAGVIHRDLKPGNILLADPPGTPLELCTPKISDFGLARRLDEVHGLTLSGQVIGTPGYMAPEQASGFSDGVGTGADIYALGVLLYEMLAGRPPFRGSTALETVHLMLSHDPLPPTRLRRDLPRDLETICLHCLQRDPRKRYANVGALADDLGRFLAGRPIHARPTTPVEVVWKWSRRQPATAALAFGFIALLAISFGLLIRGWRGAEAEQILRRQERDRAVFLAEAATAARRSAEQLAARLELERGATFCESGEHGPGLHWLLRGLERIPADSPALEASARLLTAGWRANLHELERFHVHPGKVSCLAFLTDGKTLAASVDRRVWLHGPGGTAEPLSLPGIVLALATTANGTFAVTSTDEHEVGVWSLPEGKPVGPPIRLASRPKAASLSSDGATLLLGLDDHTAWTYDPRTGRAGAGPLPHQGAVLATAISPDGRHLLTGSKEHRVRLWSLAGRLVAVFKDHPAEIQNVAFSPDGQCIVSTGDDRRVVVRRTLTGAKCFDLPHDKNIETLAIHPREPILATGCDDNIVRLWHLETGKSIPGQIVHTGDVLSLAFSPAGVSLATGGEDCSARVWRLARPTECLARFLHPRAVLSLVSDGDGVLTGCSDGGVRRWTPAGAERLLKSQSSPLAMALHAPSAALAVGYHDGDLEILDAATGERRAGPWVHKSRILSVAISPDGKLVATGHDDPDWVIRVREVATGRLVRELVGHIRKVSSLAFSPDNALLLSASWDMTARFWDVKSGEPVGEPMRHQDLVQSVAFAPDGRVALTGGDDYTSRLWHVPSGRPRGQPQLHPDKVQSVAFSPTGTLFATGGKAGVVRLWEPNTGRVVGRPWPHEGEIYSLAFGDAGRTLFSGSWKGDVRAWAVPDGQGVDGPRLRRSIEVHTGTRLTPEGDTVPLPQADWEALAREYLGEKQSGRRRCPSLTRPPARHPCGIAPTHLLGAAGTDFSHFPIFSHTRPNPDLDSIRPRSRASNRLVRTRGLHPPHWAITWPQATSRSPPDRRSRAQSMRRGRGCRHGNSGRCGRVRSTRCG